MKTLLLFCLFLNGLLAYAQKEANIWYFGENAGVDFNSGKPFPLVDGKIKTQEGVATISDNNGNLLFYTDGMTVWNKFHEKMPNGEHLKGDISATQAAIIVPKPNSSNIYYIFTVTSWGSKDGLNYSVVDMTADKGKGDVIKKNDSLFTPVTEKLTAVLHKNKESVWVITHDYLSAAFRVYLVTKDGLDKNPVISEVGEKYYAAPGYLKVSPDGRRLATAVWRQNSVDLFDFNNETGEISNPMRINSGGALQDAYGVEFSPDGSKLYVTTWHSPPVTIMQLDLSNYNKDSIKKSIVKIAENSKPQHFGALQLGPDDKIYIVKNFQHSLAAINTPNAKGDNCNYIDSACTLETGMGRGGLPTFIQSYFISDCEDAELKNKSNHLDIINIYPNPSNSEIVLSFNRLIKKQIIISVYDLTGRILFVEKINPSGNTIRIDLSRLIPNVYYCRIFFEGRVITKKIILIE
jgi:hypothetical protein